MYKGKKRQAITVDEKKKIIAYCNRDIVPDRGYKIDEQYPTEWFEQYFDFLGNIKLRKQLGAAFYQARFTYKLMNALNLPKGKYQGIVKFQIIQYASICEAILDYVLGENFKSDIGQRYADEYYSQVSALASNAKIVVDGKTLYTCEKNRKRKELRYIRIDHKTEYAKEKGIISQDTKEKICALYNLRNTVHILKATEQEYFPKVREAKEAFDIMQKFCGEVKQYCEI